MADDQEEMRTAPLDEDVSYSPARIWLFETLIPPWIPRGWMRGKQDPLVYRGMEYTSQSGRFRLLGERSSPGLQAGRLKETGVWAGAARCSCLSERVGRPLNREDAENVK